MTGVVLAFTTSARPARAQDTPPAPVEVLPMEAYYEHLQRRLFLPGFDPGHEPPSPPVFRWDHLPVQDPQTNQTRVVSFVPDPWNQQGGTCYLFATIGAAEVQAAYKAWLDGWSDDTGRTDLGFHLSPMTFLTCDHCSGRCSGGALSVGRFLERFGAVDQCVDPFLYPYSDRPVFGMSYGPGIPFFRDINRDVCPENGPHRSYDDPYLKIWYCGAGTCGLCEGERYWEIQPGSEDYPNHWLCGPAQAESGETLAFRGWQMRALAVHGDGRLEDANLLANFIREQGPVIEMVAWGTTPGDKTTCTPTHESMGSHFIHLIGYDFTNPDAPRFLLRNSHGDQPFWIDYNQWAGHYDYDHPSNAIGCGIADGSVGFLLDSIQIDFVSTLNTHGTDSYLARACDPDEDGVVGSEPNLNVSGIEGVDPDCPLQSCTQLDWSLVSLSPPLQFDNCPMTPNPDQRDGDEDGIGDACDDTPGIGGVRPTPTDADGDGYEDQWDCDRLNPYLGPDLDQDGFCDGYTRACSDRSTCEQECLAACSGRADELLCRDRCHQIDQCMGLTDPVCTNWSTCMLDGMGCEPDPTALSLCAERYWDYRWARGKCMGLGVDELQVQPHRVPILLGPLGLGGAVLAFGLGGTYDVFFRARSKELEEVRTGSSLGACTCDVLDENGDWREDYCRDVCPYDRETDQQGNLAWNPITSEDCDDLTTDPGLDSEHRRHVAADHMCFAKHLSFTRDPLRDRRAFAWDWRGDVRYDDWSTRLGAERDASSHPKALTQVRVAWPPFGRDPYYTETEDHHKEVAYSSKFYLWVGQHLEIHGDLYLGAQIVLSKIPGVVDGRLDPKDPVSPVSLLAYDEEQGQGVLYRLGGTDLGPIRLAPVQAEGLDFTSVASAVTTWVDSSDTGGRTEVLVCYEALGEGSGQLWTGPVDSDPVQLVPLSGSLSSPLPALESVRLVALPAMQSVLLTGQAVGSDHVQAVVVNLASTRVSGPVDLPVSDPQTLRAISDPRRNLVYMYTLSGGAVAAPQAQLLVFDPMTGATRNLTAGLDFLDSLARLGPALWLDRTGRFLYLYGGQFGEMDLGDLWRFDLVGRTVEEVADGPAVAGADPLFVYDERTGEFAARQVLGTSPTERLPTVLLDRRGQWHQAPLALVQAPPTWPAAGSFDPRLTRPLVWQAALDADEPGQWVLLRVDQGSQWLSAQVTTMDGQLLAARSPQDAAALGFACPAAQVCWVSLGGPDSALGAPYQVDAEPAHLEFVEETAPAGRIRDLVLLGNAVYVGGGWGLARREADGTWHLRHGRRHSGITALAPCRGHLCASRLGPRGLALYEPQSLEQVAAQWTVGPSFDLAVAGSVAYVANGPFGFGIYDLASASRPHFRRQVWTWSPVVSVAVRGDLLAVGYMSGKVAFLRRSAGLKEVGSVDLGMALRRIRFRFGRLWAEGYGPRAKAVDVLDPSQPTVSGLVSGGRRWARWAGRGVEGYSYEGRHVEAFEVVGGE